MATEFTSFVGADESRLWVLAAAMVVPETQRRHPSGFGQAEEAECGIFLAKAGLGAEDFWHIEDHVGVPCSKLSPSFCLPRPAATSLFVLTSSGTTELKATSATGETKLTMLAREFWLQWLCGHICLVEDVYLYKDGIAGGMCCKQPDYLKDFLSLPLARVESLVYSKRYTTGFLRMTMWNKQEGKLKMWFALC